DRIRPIAPPQKYPRCESLVLHYSLVAVEKIRGSRDVEGGARHSMSIIDVVDQLTKDRVAGPASSRWLAENVLDLIQEDQDSPKATVAKEGRESSEHLLCVPMSDR